MNLVPRGLLIVISISLLLYGVRTDPCPTNCTSCTPSVCSTCDAGFYLLGISCTQSCGDGKYSALNNQGQLICQTCLNICQTCTGPTTCTACKTGRLFVGGTGCGDTCPFGQYPSPSSSTACLSCPPSCATCSSATACTSCPSTPSQTYLHTDGACYNPCPTETYPKVVSGAYLCTPCPTGCADCSVNGANVECSECKPISATNFYLSGTQCVQTCPDGEYGGTVSLKPECVTCDPPCEKCKGAGSSACLSCSNDTLKYGTNTCGACVTGTYANTAKTCAPCDTNCASCQTTATNCLTCGIGKYLYTTDNKCYGSCPSGSYLDASNKCTDCPSGCAACSLVSSTVQCSLCKSVANVQFYLLNKACTNDCGNGKYGGVNSNIQPVCSACVTPCGNCVSATSCLTCTAGVLVVGGTTCSTTCPFGQYSNTASTCASCGSNCASCSGAAATCTSCGILAGSQSYLHTDNVCYAPCPTETYGSNVNGAFLCLACPTGCKLCSVSIGKVTCTQCKSVLGTNFYRSGTQCVQTCPAGKYGGTVSSKPECIACEDPCATCDGAGQSACLSCKTDRLIFETKTCGACVAGTYADTAKTCAQCDPSCASCQTSATNCLSCEQGKNLYNNKCYDDCPSSTYADTDNDGDDICTDCPAGCATCSLVDAVVECSLCKSVAGVQFYRDDTSCTNSCSSGTFGGVDSSFNPVCNPCQSPCDTCLTPTVCLSCETGLLVYGTTYCSTKCPFGQYMDSATTCGPCDANCASCVDDAVTCTSCGRINGVQAYLYSDDTCKTTCPDGSYKSNVDGAYLCVPCLTGCAKCALNVKTVQCTQCAAVNGTNFFLQGKTCVQACPSGKYGGTNNSKPACVLCDSPCATCNATGSSACLSCKTDRLIYGTTTCGTCVGGTYGNTTRTCAPCDDNCATCQTTATNCLTCPSGQYLSTVDKKCYDSCPNGSYLGANNKCTACTTGCAACSLVDGIVQCTECKSVNGDLYYLSSTSCTTNCGNGKYGGIDATTSKPACIACQDPCGNCVSDTSCLTCDVDLLVFEGDTCQAECPEGQYASSTHACSRCNSNCETCETSATTCLSCGIKSGAQTYLYSDDKCYINCPSGSFKNSEDTSCSDCDDSCSGCIDTSKYCIACATDYFRVIGSSACTQDCEDGYYGNPNTDTCTACPIGCAICQMSGSTLSCSECTSFAGVQYYLESDKCVSLCPAGTFQGTDPDNSLTTCLPCTSPCENCAGSATYCTSCDTDYLIVGQNSCGDCPEGQYADGAHTCALCSPNCANCSTNADTCGKCGFSQLGYQLFLHTDDICYQTCPWDYFGNTTTKKCQECSSTCEGCVNSGTNCIDCATDNFRVIGSNACTDSCGTGLYGDSTTGLCTVCPIGCKTCSQTDSVVSCQQCKPVAGVNYYLDSDDDLCKSTCPASYFGGKDDSNKPICDSCDESCATCNGTESTNCLSCSDSNYLVYQGTQCVDTCDEGQYASINNLCALCSLNCKTCDIIPSNCTGCGRSVAGINLYLSSGACLAKCPDGYYADTSGPTCQQCDDSCETCFGQQETQCLTCSSGSWLSSNSSCISDCPKGQYSKDNVCYPCLERCAECSSATTCSECQPVAGLPYYLDDNDNCVVICPDGTYPDPDLTCTTCTSPCATCSKGSTLCTSCDDTTSTPYLEYGTFTCLDGCPGGQFAPSGQYICVLCNANCKTCETNTTNCLSCGLSLAAGLPLYLSGNACVANCPFGQYGDTDTCTSCDDSCSGCTLSSNNCISCAADYFREVGSNECTDSCPNGYYPDATTSMCTLCPFGCKLCQIDAGTIACSECQTSAGVKYYLDTTTDTCVPTCPSTYYALDDSPPTCQACQGNCSTCTDADNCITCIADTYLWFGETKCTGQCPDGQYHPANVGKCNMCSSFCKTCSLKPSNCTNCTSVGGVAYFLNASNCLPVCPKGKYGNLDDFTCKNCADGCESCFGAANTSCYSCKKVGSTNYYLEYGEFNCLTTCLAGQYANSTSFKCLLCSANCATCSSSSTNCSTCGFSSVGMNLYLSNNKCVASCPQGQWGNSSDYKCTNCADECLACFGPSISNCTLCGNASTKTYYKHIGDTVCNTTCPDGQFISGSIPNFCQPCSSICVTCEATAENCTSSTCAANFFFLSNECLSECPNGYYADRSARQCLECDTACTRCFDSGDASCTACSSGYYLQMGSTQCLDSCNDGQFANDVGNVCTPCVSACAKCTSLTTCDTCQSVNGIAYFSDVDKCTVKCPQDQFGKINGFICSDCADGCATCYDADIDTCYTCKANSTGTVHFLIYGTDRCDPSCPDGQYKNSTAFQCLLCSSICKTCDTNSTNCLSCGPSPFGYSVFLNGNRCLANCPSGLWANSTGFTCDSCKAGCTSCFGPGLDACTACGNDSATVYYKWIGETVCNTTCPNGQFISVARPYFCQACSPLCVTCAGTAENCTSDTCAQNFFFNNFSCLAVCPNGKYADTTERQCLGCDPACATCFASDEASCTVCSPSHYLQIGSTTCLDSCNDGQFANDVGNVCTPCVAACATCTSLTICDSCQNVNGIAYFRDVDKCTVKCPSNQYGKQNGNVCTDCADGCATCFGNSLQDCYTCDVGPNSTNYYLIYGTTYCNKTCPDGQYANSTSYKCLLCTANCLTCEGNSKKCTSCGFSSAGYLLFLENSTCKSICSVGLFRNKTSMACQACKPACTSCDTFELTTCYGCQAVNNSGNITKYYKYIGATICGTGCPLGQFIDDNNSPNACVMCDANCVGCYGQATNCTQDDGCKVNYFYNNATNSCVLICPDGTFRNVVTKFCQACAVGCELCYGPALTQCTRCLTDSDTSTPYFLMINLDECATSCNSDQYGNATFHKCMPCNPACAACDSQFQCTTCTSVNGIAYFLDDTTCSVACPSTQYGDVDLFQCTNCADECATCFGSQNTDCNSCKKFDGDDYFLVHGTKFCNISCPNGQYKNTTDFTCKLCSTGCLTCTNTSLICLSCGFSSQGYNLYLHNNKCLMNCPKGYWGNSTTNTCDSCKAGCTSCFGPGLDACTACGNDSATVYYKWIGETVCNTTCPNGQFISVARPYFCQACSPLCVTCAGTAENCTSDTCAQNFFFNNFSCLAVCPNGKYADTTERQCLGCDPACATCFASDEASCTVCSPSHYLQIGSTTCLDSCNDGQFANDVGNVCTPCVAACATCTSLTICGACDSVNGIAYFLDVDKCTVKCPSDQFGKINGFICSDCADGCATCYDADIDTCYTCKANSTGTVHFLIYGTDRCDPSCPDGQYKNSTAFQCLLCSSICKTCDTNSTNCLSCGMSPFGYAVFLNDNRCLAACPTGKWANATTYKCDTCQVGCTACFAGGLTSCTACGNDSSTIYYKYIGDTICNTTCPDGQFISSRIHNLCQPCSPICVTCFGSAQNCTSATCAQNYYFLNNSCLSICPNHYYSDPSVRRCLNCDPACSTCFGNGSASCTVCNSGNYLQIQSTTCSSGCNNGQFANAVGNKCTFCVPACATCTSLTTCQTCQSVNGIAYFLDVDKCTVKCPSTQFGKLIGFNCTDCADGCKSCFAGTLSSCYTCGVATNGDPYFLIYGTNTCTKICPDGQYSNSTSYTCMLCNANCLTCNNTSSYCLTCGFSTIGANLYLYGSSCLLTCPNGFFANSTGNTCDPCNFGCATCTGPLLTNCTVCKNHNNSGTIDVYYKVVGSTKCDTSCPTGQFISPLPNACAYCDPSCISCIITSTNCTVNACNVGYYYLATNSSCIATCPNNYYANTTTGLCTVCAAGCQLCFGGSLNECTQCQVAANNDSYYKVIDVNTCTKTCPYGSYPYPLLLACQYCHVSCLTCKTSAIDCQTCNNVTGIPYFYLSDKCLAKCPNGYYGEVSNNTCVLCPTGCSLCFGGTQIECTKCTTALTVPYFLVFGTTNCSTGCPDGQYSNTAANSCFLCDPNCNTCVENATYCLTCTMTVTGINLYLENHKCLQACSISMYEQFSNNTCQPCDPGCLVCTGPTRNECQACRDAVDPTNSSHIIRYYLIIGNTICSQICPIGQFIRAGFPNACQPCSVQCIGCSVTSINCTQQYLCSVGYFFYRATNSCLTVCPGGYYANSTTKYCEPCIGGCTLCFGGSLQNCTMCRTDPASLIPYYKEIYMAWCVDNCIDGEFEVLSDHSCQPCHASCVLCQAASTACQQCRNVSGVLYFYFANQCLINCPNGRYGQGSNNTCVLCNPACLTCFGPSTIQCYSCKPDNNTGIYYYLSFGTTYCVDTCPYGQYAVNGTMHTCQPCSINCATCVGTSTNCLTCTFINTINIVYLHNNTCIPVCPNRLWMNGTVALDHMCSPCHSYCAICTGPSNSECSVCTSKLVNGTLQIYYKDLYSTTCNTTCPDGQFISALVPNLCVPCSTRCLLCSINSTNCFRCAFNFYLFVPKNTCESQCPPNYYNDPVMTPNYYYCTQCTPGCLTCTGPSLSNCQTCQNTTISGISTYFFKDPVSSICNTTCRTGFFGNILNNQCDPCQTGCVNCSGTAINCFACRSAGGNDYFLPKNSNSCVLVCPDGYYGNSTDYTCRDCIYYTLNGSCIFTCPAGTFGMLVGNKSVCQDCDAPTVTGNPCNRSYTFKVQTTVADGGQSLVHKVILAGGLSPNVTVEQLRANLSVSVTTPARRRLLVSGRLLAVSSGLQIKDVSISSDRTVIYIKTNYQSFDLSTANVVINFPANSLVSSDGLLYQSTTGSFSLASPIFMQSYYSVFSKDVTLGAEGMIFVILSLLLLGMQLVIANRKGYHEALAFIMTLQVLGLTRARQYPIDFDVYSVLVGYSYFELSFIPNPFSQMFPPNYVENALETLTFSFGGQNLIFNLGSIIIIFLSLQALLAIYYVAKNDRPEHVARMKLLQETIICLFMAITIYFSAIGMMSVGLNSLVGMNTNFLASICLSVVLLLAYALYFIFWVRPFRLFELYKINNIVRIIGLVVIATNRYGGIIVIDIAEILFFLIDVALYRTEKLHLKLYVAERILILIAFNASVLSPDHKTLLGIMGSTMAAVFLIKLYYTAITTKEFIDIHKLAEPSQIDISDVVNLSVKEKADPDYSKLQAKESMDQKLNHSDNFIFNQTIDIQRLEESPTKHGLMGLDQDSSQHEEEKRQDDIPQSSDQSEGELIVYLDPEDYKEEFLRKQQKDKQRLKQQERERQKELQHQREMWRSRPNPTEDLRPTTSQMRPGTQARTTRRALKVDGMRTGANFYPRARGPQNHQIIEEDVEVIKVEPNQSEVDQSDIISDTTEGPGWLPQEDERNASRARQNKTVWKIVDPDQPSPSKK